MQPIIDFFSNIFSYIVDAASSVLSWLLSVILTPLNSLLDWIANSLPDLSSYWAPLSEISDSLAVVNTFFPLYEAGFFVASYVAFIAVFLVVKYIIKIFVPFVG